MIMPARAKILLLTIATVLVLVPFAPPAVQAFLFEAPRYSSLDGERTESDRFVVGGIEQECDETIFEGTYYQRTLELVPLYEGCTAKAMGGLPSRFILYNCAYLVRTDGQAAEGKRWTAPVDLTCPTNYAMRWIVYESTEKEEEAKFLCTTVMFPQKRIGTAELTNTGGRPTEINIRWDLRNLEYEAYGSSLYCGSPEGAPQRGGTAYSGSSTIRAIDSFERPVPLAVTE